MPDPRGPLYEGHPRDLLSPYELAQSYRKVNPGLFDDLDDAELVRAIKKADPETYKLMDPLLEGAENLLVRQPTPPPAPRMEPPPPQLSGFDRAVTAGLRTIPTIGGSIVGGIMGNVPGAMLGGGGGAALGESAAQAYEKAFGPREEYSIPAIGVEAGLGMIPIPAARAATLPGRLATSAAWGAGLGAVGGPARTAAEEHRLRLPTAEEIGYGAAFGAATHGGFEAYHAGQRAINESLSFTSDLTGMPPAETANRIPPPPPPPIGTPPPPDWEGPPGSWEAGLAHWHAEYAGDMAADLGPLAAASQARYAVEEKVLAKRLTDTFGPTATRPPHAVDFHTASQARGFLDRIKQVQEQARAAEQPSPIPSALPPTFDMLAGAPASSLVSGEIVPQEGPFAPNVRQIPEQVESLPPPPTEAYQPSPITGLTDQLQLNLNAPPGPPRLVPRPLELTPPPVPRETPRPQQGDMLSGKPKFNQPIEQTGEMGGREATPEQPKIPGIETPGHDRPYATGPNAGPRRKGEVHGTPRTVRRQVRAGNKVSYENVQTKLPAEDPGTYPPEVRRELATIAWELEKYPRTKVDGGTSMAAAEHLVKTGQASDIAEAIGMLKARGATAGGWLPGSPVYNEIRAATEGGFQHVTREDMLRMIREALLEGKGNALTDAAAQVARGRLSQRARSAAGEELPLVKKPGQPDLLGAPPKMQRGEHNILSQGHEGDELIGWVDEAGNKTLPSQDVDDFVRTAREASDSEIMAAVRWRQAGEPIKEGLEGFFDAAQNEAIRRGLIRYQQPGLEMGGPGGDKGPSLFDFEGGPPERPEKAGKPTGWEDFEKTVTDEERLAVEENARDVQAKEEAYREVMGIPEDQPLTLAQKVEAATGTFVEKVPPGFVEEPPPPPTALSELTARRKARALENAAQQEEIPPPPSPTPEQQAANEAYRQQRLTEIQGGGEAPPPVPAQARLPHEHAGLPGLEAPPPPPGTRGETTTLYRGQARPGGPSKLPAWVKADPHYRSIQTDASGRWWTSNPEDAAWYAREAGDGQVLQMQIPREVADRYTAANDPVAARFSRREGEFFLPREVIDQYLGQAPGEAQPTLPGTEGVREQNIPTPEVADLPFALTPPPSKPGKATPPAPSLFDRLKDERGVMVFDVPPNDRAGLKRFMRDMEKLHGGEAWYARAEKAIEDGDWDKAWKAAASASMRSFTKATENASEEELRALTALARGTPLQDDLRTQIVAGARKRAGVGEEPRGTGFPPTKRVTQAGAARGKAKVGPAGILNPGERQRPLSSIAPELRAATLDRSVVRLIKEELEGNEELLGQLSTVPGNTDTFIRLFRQVGEQVYKGENLKLLREAGVKISPEELAQHWNATISDAGRTLQMLSAFAQAHREVLTEAAARMDFGAHLGGGRPYVGARARVLTPAGQRAAQEVVEAVAQRTSDFHAGALARDMQKRNEVGLPRALHDASYAWMLSKWNTAVRNYISFTGRYSVDSLDHALTIPLARLMGDESTAELSKALIAERGVIAPGRTGTAVTPWKERGAWGDDLQSIYDFTVDSLNTLDPKDARRAIRLLLDVPEQAGHFLGRATGEDLKVLADYSNTPVVRHLLNPKVQRVLTMFNRAQEFSARATVFDATTRALLRARGLDATSLLQRPVPEIIDAVGGQQAFEDIISTATAQSLEATFAGRTSRDSIPGWLVRSINDWWPAKLGIPFPRFNLSAAPRWLYDHSPAAIFDLMRMPLDRAGLTSARGTTGGGRLYRGVRAREIRERDLPLLQEKITGAERAQGTAMQELLATQKEWSVRQRQIARLEKRAQENLPGTQSALTEARQIQADLAKRRDQMKFKIWEQRNVVKDLQSQRAKLLDRVADATAINAPNYAQYLARMATGTVGGLGAAWIIRSQDGAKGTRWYEYRIDREGKDPIIMDLRPFAPFAQYLFVADVLKDFYDNTDWDGVRKETSNLPEGTPDWMEHALTAVAEPIDWTSSVWNHYQGKYTEAELGSQFAQAFLSISRAAGTTLTLTDLATANGFPSLEEFGRAMVGTIGQFFSRFTVPGQQISDILTAPFSEEEAKVRTPPRATLEDWERPLAGPIANVPFAKQLIPERISQTTGQPVATEYPLLRGLLGIGTSPRDFVVEEMRRIGLPGQSVFIRETGDYGLDRSVAENYAKILKQYLPPILEGEVYKSFKTPALQRDFMQRTVFPILKRAALAEARATVGSEQFTQGTVRGEEARRKQRQEGMLRSLEAELPPEEMEQPPGPPAEAPPPPPF